MGNITIYDLARELGVNPSTVSRAFSNPSLVREKTRRLIYAKAEELGYQPNLIASQLRGKNSNIIALVSLQDVWTWFTDALANGVQDAAYERGYEIVVLKMDSRHSNSVRLCEQMRFGGVIVANTELGAAKVSMGKTIPMVFINQLNVQENIILPDEEYGVGLVMDYFRAQGHRKIGYINGPEASYHSGARKNAYLKKMREFAVEPREEWIGEATWSVAKGREAAGRILAGQDPPTAIFAADDNIALGVYQAAMERGLSVGRDISVIGCNNMDSTEFMIPELTTISFPLYEMGKQAVEMLDAIIKGNPYEKKVTVRGDLVVRNSVGKAGQ